MLNSVDLPHPLGQTTARNSCSSTSRSISWRTSIRLPYLWNRFVTPLNSRSPVSRCSVGDRLGGDIAKVTIR
jgi:hypothetical protein